LSRPQRRGSIISAFVSNVAKLVGGTSAGHAITLVSLPILTRLYDPGQYGLATLFYSIAAISTVVATCRYEQAITIPRTDRAALQVTVAALICLGITVAIAAACFPLLRRLLDPERRYGGRLELLFLLVMLLLSLFNIARNWAVRRQAFGQIARMRVSQSLAGAGTQIAFGIANFGVIGLVTGQLVGQAFGLARLIREIPKPSARLLAWISFIPFAILAVMSEYIVRLLFGPEWQPAAYIVYWTALWGSWQLVVSPISSPLIGLEAQRTNVAMQAMLFSLRCVALLAGYWIGSEYLAVLLARRVGRVCSFSPDPGCSRRVVLNANSQATPVAYANRFVDLLVGSL
jgi:O-antigen/teichoic acid export membrane protein